MVAVLVRVAIAMKTHHDRGYSYKGKHLIGTGLQFREVQSIIIMVGHGSEQADVVLER